MNNLEKNGCSALQELWKVALECNIENPGISGSIERQASFVKCGNVATFMNMAALKCWEERIERVPEFPPIVHNTVKILGLNSSSYSTEKDKKK